jgi:heme/copper-type cytochrome/quinol oxidase subunit 2
MDITRFVVWLMGVVLIGIGLPLFYLGRYFRAPEGEKKQKARDVQVIAIIWMAAGVLIYLVVLIKMLIVKS